MKKFLTFIFILTGCFAVAKAQSLNFDKPKTDTIKTFSDLAPYLKQHPTHLAIDSSKSNKSPFADQGESKKLLRFDHKIPFVNGNPEPERMPFVTPDTADRMPTLKLRDTETMHYTMLIKKIPGGKRIHTTTP